VGWSSVQEHIAFELVPMTDATELQVLIKGVFSVVGYVKLNLKQV
jgi:hypothetical protein